MGNFPRNKKQAETELARHLVAADNGATPSREKLTLASWLEDYWLPHQRSKAKPVSMKTYERQTEIVRQRLIPAFGHTLLSKLDPVAIEAKFVVLRDTGGRNGGPLSAQTILHYHRTLHASLEWAVKKQRVPSNVAKAVSVASVERKEMLALNEQQSTRLLELFKGTALEMPVLFALYTGVRRGELLAVQYADINFDDAYVTIRRSLEETRSGLNFKVPKNGKSRTIPLVPRVLESIRHHRARQAAQRLALGPAYQNHDLVFAMEDGSPWKPHAFGDRFRWKVQPCNEIPHIRLHDVRHTTATLLRRAGVSIKDVSTILGHSTVAVTADIYTHTLRDDSVSAMTRLADRLEAAR